MKVVTENIDAKIQIDYNKNCIYILVIMMSVINYWKRVKKERF